MKFTEEKTYSKIFHYLALFLFAGLFIVGFVVSGINYLVYDEYPSLENSNVFMVFVGLAATWFILKGLSKLYDKFLSKINPLILTTVFCIIAYAVSALWVISAQAVPQADQLTVYNNAKEIANGTLEPLCYDSYLVFFPYQLGFVSFLRILIAIFGEDNFIAYQLVLAGCSPIIVGAGSGIIGIIASEKHANKARFLYGVLMLACVPMHMYTTFIYGDLPFAAMSLVCIWMMLKYLESKNPVWAVHLFFACGFTYLLKVNALIVFLAMGIYLLLSLFDKQKRVPAIIAILAVILGTFAFNGINQKIYADIIPSEYDSPPMLATIVMGMHDDYSNAGWCNFYHQNVFSDCNFNAAATKAQCLSDMKGILGYWLHNPLYMLDFFYRKINLQWNTPLYQALVMNSTHTAEAQNALGHAIYDNQRVHLRLQFFMKAYQIAMYGFMALALLISRKKKIELKRFIPMIAVFGSFLFSLMWETKTRYQMPAFIMLIVSAAAAVPYLQEWASEFKKTKIQMLFSSEEKNSLTNHNGIDLFKIIMAFAVVAIHVMPHVVLGDGTLYTSISAMLDTAVPFFFLATGFLLSEKLKIKKNNREKQETLIKTLVKTVKMYAFWSLVYLPIFVIYCVKSKWSFGASLLYYVKGFFFTGDYYNSYILWYLLSSIYALVFVIILFKLNVKESTWVWWIFGILALAIYLDYLSEVENVWGLSVPIKFVLSKTINTGRLVRGLFFIPFGMLMSGRKYKITHGIIMTVAGLLMSLTGIFGGYGVVISACGLFIVSKEIKVPDSPVWKWFRDTSKGMYFIHLLVWTLLYMVMYGRKTFGPLMYVLTALVSAIITIAFVAVTGKVKIKK